MVPPGRPGVLPVVSSGKESCTSPASLAALAAATLLAGLTSAPANAASYDPAPVADGAGWLSDQVTDGVVHNDQFDFDDVGLSIDVALGLDAAGKKPSVVKAITKAVAKNVGSYTAFPPSVYAGATAKAMFLALEQGKNPKSFGGVNLVAQLEDRVASAAPITGRVEDAYDPADPFGGDFANVIGQAYAAAGLSQAKSPKAASAASFLIQQQCARASSAWASPQTRWTPTRPATGQPRLSGRLTPTPRPSRCSLSST